MTARRLRLAAVHVALLWGLWCALVAKTEIAELLAGLAAALLGAAALNVVSSAHLAHFVPRAAWLAQAWHVPTMVLADLVTVMAVLGTRIWRGCGPQSGFLRAPFDVRGDRDDVATRRALTVALLTASPNSIVLDIGADGQIVMHQLQQQSLPDFARKLGAL